MDRQKYVYSFNYDYHNESLCKLESRQLFKEEVEEKILFSNLKIDPSISAFIKCRFEILLDSENYSDLIDKIKNLNICNEGFKAEYLILNGDESDYDTRRAKLKDIGYSITGEPDFENPTIIYSICKHKNSWYFGVLFKHDFTWREHKKKPYSFSNSIGMDIGKTLVSIATEGNKNRKLLDACCGVGTILLEACIAGIQIEGCDIDSKRIDFTNKNLIHYGYKAKTNCCDIKDLNKTFDAAIIDLPYNLYSYSDDSITTKIIDSVSKLAKRIVIVSTSDISSKILDSGLKTTDSCIVEKRGKSKFYRKVWVCETV